MCLDHFIAALYLSETVTPDFGNGITLRVMPEQRLRLQIGETLVLPSSMTLWLPPWSLKHWSASLLPATAGRFTFSCSRAACALMPIHIRRTKLKTP